MEVHLKIIGVLLMLLALVHFIFPKYFNWKNELSGLSIMNRQMMYVHSFFIALVVFCIGLAAFTSHKDLMETDFGRKVSLAFGVFWGIRLVIQFFGYSPKIWRGKTFETTVHVLFSAFWAYMTAVFLTVGLG